MAASPPAASPEFQAGRDMRLAYINIDSGIPWAGTKGASVHVRAVTGALAAAGHDVTCFVARGGEANDAARPVRVFPVRVEPFSARLADRIAAAMTDPERAVLQRREISALCLNESLERSVEADHARRPFDALIERYSLWSFGGARLAARLHVPLLLEVNAPLVEETRRFRHIGLVGVAQAIRCEVFEQADRLVVVSPTLARLVADEGGDVARIAVVPNGYDAGLVGPVQNRHPAGDLFTVGFVGSLKPWHGIEVLCDAFRRLARSHAGARLNIVGDGPMREWIEQFCAEHGLSDRVHLAGGVPHETIPDHLALFDVAVAPYPHSDDFYFSPLKVFEYMGAGRAVIASRIGQISEVIEHGRTGWLVPPGSAEALADGLARLASDRILRRRLG
ncbi:MAG: glycosyltransferase family 4 protein, partial [Acidobacteriota bacterium]